MIGAVTVGFSVGAVTADFSVGAVAFGESGTPNPLKKHRF